MIIDFRVKNYRSYAEEQTLSLVATPDDALADNYCEVAGFKLLKSAGVYGPNASGKSNLIRAIKYMQAIILRSATVEPKTPKPIKPFLLNPKLARQPVEFEITFILEGIRFQYGFITGEIIIKEEWLMVYPKNHPQLWFHRKHDDKGDNFIIEFGSHFKGEKQRLKNLTRNDSLFLSAAAQMGHPALTKVYDWFANQLIIIGTKTALAAGKHIWEKDKNNEALLIIAKKELIELLQAADSGISDIRAKTADIDELIENLPSEFSDKMKKKLIDRLKEDPPIQFETVHKMPDSNDEINFDLKEESGGTQRIFALSGPWIFAKKNNVTIVVDEIESSLHPFLSRALIKMIHRHAGKGEAAQLIFATHDVTLLSNDLLRRDQIWFVEKNEKQASVLTPLIEYKPRKGESILKGYMSGRYHAVPYLKDFEIEE